MQDLKTQHEQRIETLTKKHQRLQEIYNSGGTAVLHALISTGGKLNAYKEMLNYTNTYEQVLHKKLDNVMNVLTGEPRGHPMHIANYMQRNHRMTWKEGFGLSCLKYAKSLVINVANGVYTDIHDCKVGGLFRIIHSPSNHANTTESHYIYINDSNKVICDTTVTSSSTSQLVLLYKIAVTAIDGVIVDADVTDLRGTEIKENEITR